MFQILSSGNSFASRSREWTVFAKEKGAHKNWRITRKQNVPLSNVYLRTNVDGSHPGPLKARWLLTPEVARKILWCRRANAVISPGEFVSWQTCASSIFFSPWFAELENIQRIKRTGEYLALICYLTARGAQLCFLGKGKMEISRR